MATRAEVYGGADAQHTYSLPLVIVASSVGTMIEWYDFYIFGSLAAVLSAKFYRPETIRLPILLIWRLSQWASWSGHSERYFSGALAT